MILVILLSYGISGAQDWRILKGEHFLIYYFTDYTDSKGTDYTDKSVKSKQISEISDERFATEVLNRAERYYDRIASDLGYSRYDKFWQWENRVKIYIYQSREEFIQATGREEWVGGFARYKEKEIISYRWSEGFLESLLPHELTHLIFRDFVGFTGEVPLWLDEGVAQWEEELKKKESVEITRKLIKEKSSIPIAELMQMDIRQEKDFDLVRKFYAQSVTLVGYLIEEYGGSKFTLFCRQLRDGKSIDMALSSVYTGLMPNTQELEKRWVKYYGGL